MAKLRKTKKAAGRKKSAAQARKKAAAKAAPRAKKKVTKKTTSRVKATTRKTRSATGTLVKARSGKKSSSPAGPTKSKKKTTVKKVAARTATHKTKAPTKQPPPPAVSQDPIQFPQEKPLPKTHLKAKELRTFKNLLLRKRTELVGDVTRLANEALNQHSASANDQSPMPIHMADLGTDNWEQEFTLGLLANERAIVREIDDALDRIQDKTYGVCLATRVPITTARLNAKPWAKYCIEYARAREEGTAR